MRLKPIHIGLIFIIIFVMSLMMPVNFTEAADSSQATLQNGWFKVSYLDMTDNGDGTSTWQYRVDEIKSVKGAKDLSHWVLGLGPCAKVLSASPSPYEVNKDPRTGVYGIKWEVSDQFSSGIFSFTLAGVWDKALVTVATKAGTQHGIQSIFGPSCQAQPNQPTPVPTTKTIDAPTPVPTAEPTDAPTPEPTPEPTNEPTPEPTPEPTDDPSQ
jgi:hypothetical protein